MIKELTILIVWHKESNPEKIKCFEENKRTFEQYNPGVEILVIINQFEDSNEAWLSSDLSIFNWYNDKTKSVESKRFLLIEWDCWCDISVEEYFSNTWNMDVVAPSVKYPERDSWYWFSTKQKLPDRARLYATGIVPFCGILVSEKAMKAIGEEIIKPDYRGLNSELRFASVATFLGYDPVPNPVCSRSVIWNPIIPFDFRFKGFHHPRKVLTSSCVLGQINTILDLDKCIIPRIIHQTYKDNSPPTHLNLLTETWKENHPDWHYILWTDEMNREFIKRFFPDFLLQYDSYEKNIQRVDAVRYFILYKIGGVFIDMDFECLKNIEPLISDCDSVFGLEPREHCEQFRKNKIICNAFMATKPENDFFKTICSILPSYTWKNEESYIKNILSTAGPFALTDIYNNYERKEEIKLLSSNFIYPLTVNESRRAINDDIDDSIQEKIDDAYAVHYFLGSWH